MHERTGGTRRVVAALLAFALLVSACGTTNTSPSAPAGTAGATASPSGDASPTSPTGSDAAPPEGELVVGLAAESESMDPYLVYQTAGISIMSAIFDTLLTVANDGTLGPGLATEWTVKDPTTIDLTLRDDVVFHDGEPFGADAVRFSIYRILDRDTDTGDPLPKGQGIGSSMSSDYASIESVQVVDDAHVTLKLARPDAALPAALGRLFIVPPDDVTQKGNEGFAAAPVGTGPFRFVEWKKDDHTLVTVNEDYWDSPRGKPMVDTVRFRPLTDPTTRLNELTAGGIDIMQDATVDQQSTIEGAGGALVHRDDDPHHVEIWLTTDGIAPPGADAATTTAIEAFMKPEVRQALNMGIDRQTIIDALLGGLGKPMSQLFVEGEQGHDPSIQPFAYDPGGAKLALEQAGYPDGLDVTLDYCTCDRLDPIEAAVADLADIGVRATIKPMEIGQFNQTWGRPNGDNPGTDPMRSSRLSFNDPNTFLQLWWKKDGFLSRYDEPQMDELIAKQLSEYDPAARVKTLNEIAALSHEKPGAIYLWSSPNLYAVGPNVQGWEPHFSGYLPVVNVARTG